MQIDDELIQNVAKTARINLSPEELPELKKDFEEILAIFDTIAKVDTTNITPSFLPIDKRNHLREDEPHEPLSQEDALKNAPHKKDGYILGPKVL